MIPLNLFWAKYQNIWEDASKSILSWKCPAHFFNVVCTTIMTAIYCDTLRSSVCYVPIVAKNDAHTILHTCCNYTWRWSGLPNCYHVTSVWTHQAHVNHISSSYLKFALTLSLISLIYLFSTKLLLLLAVSTKSAASAGVFNADVRITPLCIRLIPSVWIRGLHLLPTTTSMTHGTHS